MPKRLIFPGPNKDVVELEETNFFLKVETLPQPKHAQAFFILKDSEEECDIPEEIKCVDKTNNIENIKISCTEYFLLTHLNKYEFYFND
ncbi:11465_t:CDS:1, partial [Racocetra persica]